MVKVKQGGVATSNGIAVRVSFVINETLETALVLGKNGRPFEPPHSRSRNDDHPVRTKEDLYIPPADYRQMFRMAGMILGKPRKEKALT